MFQSKKFRYSIVSAVGALFLIIFFQNCSPGFNSESSGFEDSSSRSGSDSPFPEPGPTPAPMPLPLPAPLPTPVPEGGTITNLKFESTSNAEQINVPVTFGQVFALGALKASSQIAGKLSDGTILPLQVDVKASHPDGSLRHAVISAILPKLLAGQTETMELTKASGAPLASTLVPGDLVAAGFKTSVKINLGGVEYSASADDLLKNGGSSSWISGPIAHEWLVDSPLKTAQGMAHPHLTARFAIRGYGGLSQVKVDVILENNWAYQPAPQNFTYDVQIQVGGQNVYTKTALTHYHHARWRKSFWAGSAPQVHIKHNTAYLISSRALANYDQSIPVAETALKSLVTILTGAKAEPMAAGLAEPYMPATGGRPDIGLLPAWATMYLLSMDKRAKDSTLLMADLGGSWSSHYRDQKTDLPISIVDYPYMTLAGNPGDTYNPATQKQEAFPVCGGNCANPNAADTAHQPNFAYLPYLTTGEHYYLEELLFWAAYNVLSTNPHYRGFSKGLVKSEQLRGQGWSLRLIGEAAYITPDQHPLKNHFISFVNHNLDWYNAEYTNNPQTNKLGIIVNGYSLSYNEERGVAPWMDDFFTQSVGHVAELGFEKAKPLLFWKAKYQIGRMTAPGFCWISGGIYALNVRDSKTSPFYTTLKEAYLASEPANVSSLPCGGPEMAAALNLKVGEMTGYSPANAGFPSNYQPALAYSVDSGAPDGAKAWQIFMNRSVKPDYQNGPQFNIVPR